MAQTKDETIREVTLDYLEGIDLNNIPSPADIQAGILDGISNHLMLRMLLEVRIRNGKHQSVYHLYRLL